MSQTSSYAQAMKREDLFCASSIYGSRGRAKESERKLSNHATSKTSLDPYVFNSYTDEAKAFGATSDASRLTFIFFDRVSLKA